MKLTSPELKNVAELLIYEILKKNNYPVKMIENSIKRYYDKVESGQQIQNATTHGNTSETRRDSYASLTYIQCLSERIVQVIQRNAPPELAIKVAHRIDRTIKTDCFSKLKDKNSFLKNNKIIYEITCICNDKYIGQTGDYLINRLYGHKSDITRALKPTPSTPNIIENTQNPLANEIEMSTTPERNLPIIQINTPDIRLQNTTNQRNQNVVCTMQSPTHFSPSILHRKKDNSALFYHIQNKKHQLNVMDMDNIKILGYEPSLYKRLIKEMLFINDTKDTINKRTEIENMSSIYCQILSQ